MNDNIEQFINKKFGYDQEIRIFLLTLWRRFHEHSLDDRHFVTEFTSENENRFFQRYTEMLIALHLLSLKKFSIKSHDEGPDLKIECADKNIWIEIITPEPKGLPHEYLEPSDNILSYDVPHEKILMRWTAALKEKYEKLEGRWKRSNEKSKIPGYREKGIVRDNDIYVIAINSVLLKHRGFVGISQLPYAVEAAFPIGLIQIHLDTNSGNVIKEDYVYRPKVINHNGSEVPTDSFLNPCYSSVSAILATHTDLNLASEGKFPLVIVHNPLARNPLPKGLLGANYEYIPVDLGDRYQLERVSNASAPTMEALLKQASEQTINDEFEAVADQLADEFAACVGLNAPVLSDYAVSRDGIGDCSSRSDNRLKSIFS